MMDRKEASGNVSVDDGMQYKAKILPARYML
jgi:hypothetical protein